MGHNESILAAEKCYTNVTGEESGHTRDATFVDCSRRSAIFATPCLCVCARILGQPSALRQRVEQVIQKNSMCMLRVPARTRDGDIILLALALSLAPRKTSVVLIIIIDIIIVIVVVLVL